MTEDIGSDKHKRPSSAEIEVAERLAIMRERIKQADARDITMSAQLDIIIGKISKVETSLMLGERRFTDLEAVQKDTTESIKVITGRVDSIEKNDAAMTHKIVGGLGVGGFLLTAIAYVKDWIK